MRRFTLLVLALTPIAQPAASQARRPSGSAAGGVEARFDVDGAWVNAPGAVPMRVRATRFGRPGASEPVETAAPTRQGCAAPQAGCTPRVEYAGDGLTEWWRPAERGVEQGWTVWRRPGGSGPLQIDVHAAAVASAQPGGIQLSGPAGTDGDLHVGELVAWDARGRDLPARFEPTDDGFVVVVDDADAVYPVQVDPLYTAPDWSAEGSYGYIGSGLAARAIGDVNGDGYDDVGVEGYVFFGSAAGIETDAGQDLGINAEWAGDINGDGFDDVEASDAIYSGGPDGIESTPAQTFDIGLTAAGDVGGDGYTDLLYVEQEMLDPYSSVIVSTLVCFVQGSAAGAVDAGQCVALDGAPSGWSQSIKLTTADFYGNGASNILYSYATDWTGTTYVRLVGGRFVYETYEDEQVAALGTAGDVDGDGAEEPMFDIPSSPCSIVLQETITRLGSCTGGFGGVGDLDGDGYGELVVGVDLYRGSASGPVPTMTLRAHAVKAGDVNGDGLADLLTRSDSAAIVQLGSSQTLFGPPVWLGEGPDSLGSALVAVDLDQDGYDDLVAAAPSHGHAEGEVVVYPGSAAGLSETPVIAGLGESNGGQLGTSAALAGDTNGDGYPDLVVGAPGEPGVGAVHLYLGSAAGLTQAGVLAGDDDAPSFGTLVAGAGDADGDGYADVAVANGAAPFVVRVYRGSALGTDAAWATELAFDAAPTAVGSAGDVDGDGFGDLFVGCADCEDGAGAVYVFPGSESGIETTPVTLRSTSEGEGFGASVAAADIHGDGFGDLAVGAASYADGLGRVYVFRGAPTGLDDARVAVLDPPAGASEFGMALGGAGDLDGDGDEELRVEAAGEAAVTGVYTYRGGPNGLDRSLAAVTTGIASTGPFTSGDFNADGLQDLAVGSASNGGAGALDVYLGCVDADADGYCADDDCDDGDGSVPFLLYTDDDGDGFGAGSAASEGCEEGDGLVAAGTDCNDRKAEISPDAQEVCDSRGTDEDCDGLSNDDDPSVTNQVSRYEDLDGDGYGTGDPVNQCDEEGALSGGDCDDDDDDLHPDQYEACDGKDNDCDDQVDEGHDCPQAPELPSTCATAPTPPAAAALLLAAALLRRRPRP